VSVEKDKSEPGALGSAPAGRTVVGVPALTPDPPPSDAALTHQLPALDEEELPTAHNIPAVSPADADRVLSDRAPAVAGALSPRPPATGVKTPPLSGDMFRGLPRAPGRPIEAETKTRAGVAPQPGVSPKGRSTLLLDGSAPPVISGDPNSERPPIVVPASASPPPKAVTQPPPWGEGAAHAAGGIPNITAPPRAREPSLEEISASMLIPADASSDFSVPATEELSGSVLVEEPPGASPPGAAPPGARAPSVKPPVPTSVSPRPASIKPPVPQSMSPRPTSVKPQVPKSPSGRPAAHAHRTLLGMPELPKSTPGPNLGLLQGAGSAPPPLPPDTAASTPFAPPAAEAGPPGPPLMNDQPAVILAPSLMAEMQPPPQVPTFPPAPPPDFVAMPPAPGPDAGMPGPSGPPSAGPMTGDIELTRLPRSAPGRVLDEVRRLWQLLVSKLPENTALRSGSRPPWFLPAVAAAGLIVGIGLVGLLVSVLRSAAHASDKDSPTVASARASATASSGPAKAASAAPVASEPAPSPGPGTPLAPCAVSGTTHVLGPSATVAAGVEAIASGNDVALGFAPDDHSAMAIRVDTTQLTVATTARAKSHDPVRRVTPLLTKGALSLVVDTDHKGDKLSGRRTVRATPPVQIGVTSDGELSWSKIGGGPAGPLWSLGGSPSIDALRGTVDGSGDPTIAVAFRNAGAVWTGTIGGTGGLAPVGPLSHIDGLGTTIGSPAIAISSSVVMVAWADRASNDAPWRLRWTHFSAGSAPEAPADFVPPDGGKGPPYMSPALATLPGGRFLLVWTEGSTSGHVVRAQTLSLEGARLGPPLELSPDGANAGQAQAAIGEGGNGVVAFLQSSSKGFSVAATAIHCGTP
jgi:hypothetical protein